MLLPNYSINPSNAADNDEENLVSRNDSEVEKDTFEDEEVDEQVDVEEMENENEEPEKNNFEDNDFEEVDSDYEIDFIDGVVSD